LEERDFLLRWMRESPKALRVQQSPRYLELASRAVDAQFTMGDIRDLQVWFNLAWCDPVWVESDPRLAELKRKDRDFSESDKAPLFQAQMEMMQKVIPKYRELADRGQAELTFSPYYHPILPLLTHVDSARIANPQIQLPTITSHTREDAERQISLGLGLFERLLGRRPKGMWPSEMAVGDSVIGLATGANLDWMISDEEVLARSLKDLSRVTSSCTAPSASNGTASPWPWCSATRSFPTRSGLTTSACRRSTPRARSRAGQADRRAAGRS